MATYWAELDTNNIVRQVITGVDDATIEGIPTGDWYTNYVGSPCVQTFIDDPTKTYAGIGYTYDAVNDNFIAPQPYPSWVLDSNDIWQPPVPQPPAPPRTYWDEDTQTWLPYD